jgi:predicted AlkP superfamily pyrophosphatase or phosphodiesterase
MRFVFVLLFLSSAVIGQNTAGLSSNSVARPKLVVGIVVDQMRWDYLYRYYSRYAPDGGFKRLINQGFSCENTFINYLPSYTACGHTCIYTGSVPSIHGITGNDWYDYQLGKNMYCTEDSLVHGIGTNANAGKMSPRNLQVTTICDELRLATNFRGKVIGIAIKDRGGILPAGHAANAAYWYEGASGNWISSSYYMQSLPQWVQDFNARKMTDGYYKEGWNTLYPINTYTQSTADEQQYESKPFGNDVKKFPYRLDQFIGKNYGAISGTPYGNSMTKEMAMAAVTAEQMGKDTITDFLAVSFSSTDYVGHAFGPNAIEVEDTYLHLDRDLGDFFHFLDNKVGKGQYLVFLSADHGVSHVPGFASQNNIPGGVLDAGIEKALDSLLRKQFGDYKFILATTNSQLFFNHHLMDSLKTDKAAVSRSVINYLSALKGIDRVFETSNVMNIPLVNEIRTKVVNGYYPSRSGDIQIIAKSGWMNEGTTGTTHGSWNPYDTHIPLLWYGWNVKHGKTNREIYMTDIAPTVAGLLHVQMPSGSIGKVITEVQQ